MSKENQYFLNIDYSPAKQARLKQLVGIIGAPSVRAFIANAIDEQIAYELNNMPEAKRAAAIALLGPE